MLDGDRRQGLVGGQRQVGRLDDDAVGGEHGLLDDVAQLGDVAVPSVAADGHEGVVREHHAGLVGVLLVGLVQQPLGQFTGVVTTLAQGRQAQVHLAQAIVQVAAELSLDDAVTQRRAGDADDLRQRVDILPARLAVVDQVQQLGLGGGVELLDVFQDDDGLAGALVLGGRLAEGDLDVDAARVAVAADDRRHRHGRQLGAVGTGALAVVLGKVVGQGLATGARFALDQDAQVVAQQATGALDDAAHGSIAAHQARDQLVERADLGEADVVQADLLQAAGALHGIGQDLGVGRIGQYVVDVGQQQLAGQIVVGGADGDDLGVGAGRGQLATGVHGGVGLAGATVRAEVEHDDVDFGAVQLDDGFLDTLDQQGVSRQRGVLQPDGMFGREFHDHKVLVAHGRMGWSSRCRVFHQKEKKPLRTYCTLCPPPMLAE